MSRKKVGALIAEYFRIEAEWNSASDNDEDAYNAAVKRFSRQEDRLQAKIVGMVSTSIEDVSAQVHFMRWLCTGRGMKDPDFEWADRLEASIVAGIERLAGRTPAVCTSIAARFGRAGR